MAAGWRRGGGGVAVCLDRRLELHQLPRSLPPWLLDFELSSLREDVVRALRPKASKRQRDAYAHYMEGLRLLSDNYIAPTATTTSPHLGDCGSTG